MVLIALFVVVVIIVVVGINSILKDTFVVKLVIKFMDMIAKQVLMLLIMLLVVTFQKGLNFIRNVIIIIIIIKIMISLRMKMH